jgi:hypothetical protein
MPSDATKLARWTTLILQSAILLLAFILPFELTTPWISVGSIAVLTDVEVVMYAALALWLARQIMVKQVPRWRTPLTLPLLLVLLALLLSGIFAPSENWHAFKVTARVGTGAAIFFLIVNSVDAGLSLRHLMQAFVLGGIIVALFALLESTRNEAILMLLAPFRRVPHFEVGGQLRSSSSLAYPTIASAYFEFIFFFLVGCLTLRWSRQRCASAGLSFGALVLVAAAIVLTLTRSALFAIGGAIAFVVALRWRDSRFDRFALTVIGAGLGLAVLVLAASVFNPSMLLRWRTESDRSWFQARYSVAPLLALHANETITVTVQLENIGQHEWNARGDQPVHLFYHWLNVDSTEMVVVEGLRTELPRDVAPGEKVTLNARLRAPPLPDKYVLGWDMVREGVFWFSVLGWPLYEIPVTVLPGTSVAQVASPIPNWVGEFYLDRASLWSAALKMLEAHPLWGVGAGNFRLVLGEYLGLQFWDNRLHANNMYLEMFADAGLMGGTVFLVFVFSVIRMMARQRNHTARGADPSTCAQGGWAAIPPPDSIWMASVSAALASFFIHGITDYFLEFTPIYLLFWMTLGMLVSLQRSPR